MTIKTENPAQELANDIMARRKKELASEIKSYPRRALWLSDIADCDRYLAYSVLDWDKRPLHDESLQARFNAGRTWERQTIRELEQLGYEVTLSSQPVEVKDSKGNVIASGRIDGLIRHNGNKIPIEIKTMAGTIFNMVNSKEDFERKPWLRKYPRQLQMYLYSSNQEYGLFLITDGLGHWKPIPIELDYEQCEWILTRLERVSKHIAAKTYPDRITYGDSCEKCPFASTCLPDIRHEGMELVDSTELEENLKRRDELAPLAKEYEQIDEQVKSTAKRYDKDLIVGHYSIFLKRGERVTYDIPQELKLAHKTKIPTVTVKIVKNGDLTK